MGALLDYLNSIVQPANSAIPANPEPKSLEMGERLAGFASLAREDSIIENADPLPMPVSALNLVTCESCKHCIPSKLNPGAGWGRCSVSPKHGDYPRRKFYCPDHSKGSD